MRSRRLYLATRSERRQGAGLDLPGAAADRDVGDRGVLGLAGAVRDHRRVAGAARQAHGVQRLRQRADLVHLDQDGVGHAGRDALLQRGRVGHEQVVADQLHALAQALGEQLPAVPVVLGLAVLDGDDRVAVGQIGQILDELGRRQAALLGFELVTAGLVELACWPRRAPAAPACRRRSRRRRCCRARPSALLRSRPGPAQSRPRRRRRCSGHVRAGRRFRAWKISAPQRRASEKLGTPAGMTMNSCKSTLLSACAPPFRMFIIGTGRHMSTPPHSMLMCRYRGIPRAAAAAWAAASDTASVALAPRRALLSVPSSFSSTSSRPALVGRRPDRARPAGFPQHVVDRLAHALAAVARGVAVAQFQRLARAGGGARRHRRRGRAGRCRSARPLPRWGSRASREFRGP